MHLAKTVTLRKVFVTVFLFLAGNSVFAQDATALHNQGLDKAYKKKFEEAIQFFDKAIALNATYYAAWLDRGRAKNDLGRYNEAIADFDEAIGLDKRYPEPWFGRGVAKYYLKEYAGALSDFNYTIQLQRKNAKAYFGRGLTYIATGVTDSACADFQQSFELGYAGAKQNVDQCNELAKNKASKDNPGTTGADEGHPKLVTESSVTENSGNTQNNFVVLDTTGGYPRLVANGPMISNVGIDTSYGILFTIMPPPIGAPDAVVIYDQKLTLKQSATASIDLQLKDGKTVHAKLVLAEENQSTTKPVIFLGLFDRVNKKILGENDIDKIKIDSGKIKYEYIIADACADKIKGLLQTPAAK